MARLSLPGVIAATLIAVMTPAPAGATTYDKLTYLTFSAPVQIPGVTLAAGTYRFRLTDPATSRNVLQVLSRDGATVYAMFHTIPDSRTALTDEATVSFRETPAGVPPAVRSLFYGGEYRGYEFVYPRGGPDMIAEVRPQPEITYAPSPAAPVEVVAEPVAEPVPEPVAKEDVAAEPLPQPEPVELPRTAGPLPLVAVGGLASLLAALGLGLRRAAVPADANGVRVTLIRMEAGMAVRKAAQKPTRLSRGLVDAPGKRHRTPVPHERRDERLGEPTGKQMGQKSVKAGWRTGRG